MINLLVVLLSGAGALAWEMLFWVLPARRKAAIEEARAEQTRLPADKKEQQQK
jgi:hypothetical protein